MNDVVKHFLQSLGIDDTTPHSLSLIDLLQLMSKNRFVSSSCYTHLQDANNIRGIFIFHHYFLQLYRKVISNSSSSSSFYQLILSTNPNNNLDDKKEMVVLTADNLESTLAELDISKMNKNVIIDLNAEGRRWEGGELNDKPFGFGREYSESGNLVYEGFMYEGKKVCFGKEFNDDDNNNCLVYEGGYWNGERWGEGKSFDFNGSADFNGEWIDNHAISKGQDLKHQLLYQVFTCCIRIENEMFNEDTITTLHLSPFLINLQTLSIGQESFNYVRAFTVDKLPSLRLIIVANNCCKKKYERQTPVGGHVCIMNCPNLRQVILHNNCFEYFKSLHISNLNLLHSIDLGCWCFNNGEEFLLKGTYMLELSHFRSSIVIGYYIEKWCIFEMQQCYF